jgi:tetratricopeptide (TPR) repeat protein
MPNYYEILGVSRTASAAEIRQAYMRLAKERHPDRFPDPAERARAESFFKELTAAYNTVGNDRGRTQYDVSLSRPRDAPPAEIAKQAFADAMQCYERKDYHQAVELLRTAVHHVPNEARYHAALGMALAKNPHWMREAIQAAETATQLAPTTAAYYVELAEMLLTQGLRLRARHPAETAARLAPNDPRVQDLIGELGLGPGGEPPPEGRLRGLLRRKP